MTRVVTRLVIRTGNMSSICWRFGRDVGTVRVEPVGNIGKVLCANDREPPRGQRIVPAAQSDRARPHGLHRHPGTSVARRLQDRVFVVGEILPLLQ